MVGLKRIQRLRNVQIPNFKGSHFPFCSVSSFPLVRVADANINPRPNPNLDPNPDPDSLPLVRVTNADINPIEMRGSMFVRLGVSGA